MSSQASFVRNANERRVTLATSVYSYQVQKLANGKAAVVNSLSAFNAADQAPYRTDGQWVVPKTTGISLLHGGPAWWNYATQLAHFRRQNDQDFYLGTVEGDAGGAANAVTVNLNEKAEYVLDLARDPYAHAPIGTTAFETMGLFRRGGALDFKIVATNEAEKLDALSDEGLVIAGNPVVEIEVKVVNGGAGSTTVCQLGMSNATHATDPTANSQYLFLTLKSNLTKIQFASKDGTHTVALQDSLQTFTAGTRFEVWMDCRTPASVKLYVEGVQVLSGTTFDLSAAGAAVWKLLAWIAKTATTEVMEVQVNRLRARIMEQP